MKIEKTYKIKPCFKTTTFSQPKQTW